MTTYLAIGSHYYGVGSSALEARENRRKAGGTGRCDVIRFHPATTGVSVSVFGDVEWRTTPAEGFGLDAPTGIDAVLPFDGRTWLTLDEYQARLERKAATR